MDSVTLIPETDASTAPADLAFSVWKKEAEQKVDFGSYRLISEQAVAVKLEYATSVFPLEGARKLHASKPLLFSYVDDAGTVEIIGWNLKVNLEEASDLPRLISRRFLDLFSRTQSGGMNEQDEACFDQICERIDYRRFCAERDLPRYMEVLVIRKNPALIRYLGGANIRLEPEVAEKIELVNEGEYFGGDFTLDREGRIVDIQNIVFVPSSEDVLADDLPGAYPPCPDDFPASLRDLLPRPATDHESPK